MRRGIRKENLLLGLLVFAAGALFAALYVKERTPMEQPEQKNTSDLMQWEVEESDMNQSGLHEDKGIYEQDSNIYDVYISVFPTKDKEGNLLDFSAFSLHTARDHSYNPVLNCNIQILEEDKKPDVLLDLDHKNATIRVRGNSSRGAAYKSYKVKLEEEAGTFLGQKNLNINKHASDVCKISTKLQTDLLAGVDDIASYRTYFMRLWIRDASLPKEEQKFQYHGLYTETEQPNKTYLETRSLSSNAVMYKASDFSFAQNDALLNVDDPGYSKEAFESVLKIREGSDHGKLLEMLAAVNDRAANFDDVFHTYFDEDNYLTWLAFQMLVGNEDIINHNYILYSPQNSMKWYFIPWDFDGALRYGEYGTSVFSHEDSLKGIQKLNASVLHSRYFRLEGSIEKIKEKMKFLLETSVSRERVETLVDSYQGVLEKTMMKTPDLELLDMPPDELTPYLDGIYDAMLKNYEDVCAAMLYPAPMFTAIPKRQADGSVTFSWEASYSYQGLPVTYHVKVFSDYHMKRLVFEQDDVSGTECVMKEGLEDGTYYLLVTAKDSEGREQLSMEHVENEEVFTEGLMEFTLK